MHTFYYIAESTLGFEQEGYQGESCTRTFPQRERPFGYSCQEKPNQLLRAQAGEGQPKFCL